MNSVPRPAPRYMKPHGFTLLEVLIAVVIVALGLLGLGALHVRAMRETTGAYFRSEATVLTQDMADRIRANLSFVRANSDAYKLTPDSFNTYKTNTTAAANCRATACSLSDIAASDLAQWSIAVNSRLPGGKGTVDIDIKTGVQTWIITVYWDQQLSPSEINCPAGGSLQCVQVRMQP